MNEKIILKRHLKKKKKGVVTNLLYEEII